MEMSRSLYVSNLHPSITLEDLIIYFQSKHSGGDDVDSEACKKEGDRAIVVFETGEPLLRVLQKDHTINNHRLEISHEPAEEDENVQPSDKKIAEARTIIVSGFDSGTKDETLEMFFESERRSGGGDIEKLERYKPNEVHITFKSGEDAERVLQQENLKISSDRLQLRGKQPELTPQVEESGNVNEEAHPSENRTVVVSGFGADTKDEDLEMFFESRRRSSGGDIEKLERSQPDVVYITFKDTEVVERVLRRDNLELFGYRLQLNKGRHKRKFIHQFKKAKDEETLPSEIRTIIVSGFGNDVKDDSLEMFFESHKRSGGGDIEKLERCKPDVVYITFKSAEVAERILNQDNLEISGYRLQLARKRTELSPSLKKHEEEEAYLGEVRTVVVNGISEIKDEVLEMFFESNKRSGGGEIEKLERCGPNVAHITFKTAEVASRVLEQADKMKLDSCILQVEEKQPELFLPVDRKKIYVENLNPKTTEDSLRNYIELRAKADVCEIEFGENRNALLTFNITPDFKNFSLNNRRLEGAELKFSNPPVCNSVLVTGLTKKTTKDTIEMFFENERNGGGKIYGDIIYQRDKGIAVVSFCNPREKYVFLPCTWFSRRKNNSGRSSDSISHFLN